MLYKEWLNDWLENYVSPSAKPRTYARYSDVVQKRLIPKFGDTEMAELTPYVMQKYITELTQRGNVMTGKGLSTNTVNSIIAVIQGSLRTAYSLGLIETYTMDKIKRPKGQEKAVSCFSKQEQKIIEQAIMKVMREIFANISGCPQEEKIEAAYRNMVANNHKTQQMLKLELQKNRTQLDALRLEIGKTLTGESVYDKEDLANMITVLRSKITSAEAQLEALKQEDAAQKAVSESIIPAYQQFKTWAEEFDSAPFEMKKMIANQLFSRVEIGKGYKIRLELDATFKTFCEEWFAIQNLEAAV